MHNEVSDNGEVSTGRGAVSARVALDALDQGVVLVDRYGEILEQNIAAQRLIGGSMENFFGRDGSWQLLDADGNPYPPKQNPIYRALVTKEAVRGEVMSWNRSDGERLVAAVTVQTDPETLNTVISFVDLTAEYRARSRYNSVLEHVQVGFVVLNADGSIRSVNPAFRRQRGWDDSNAAGRSIDEVFADEEVRAELRRMLSALLSGEANTTTLSIEGQVEREDGEEMWINADVSVLDIHAGLTVITTFDITERRRFIQKLSLFQLLSRRSNDILYIVDRKMRIRHFNPNDEELVSRANRIAEQFHGLHPDDERPAVEAFKRLVRNEGENEPLTFRVKTAEGAWRYLECVGTNMLDVPEVNGLVFTCRDTTDREELNARLLHQASHDELTGLANRKTFDSHLEQALLRSARSGQPVAVAYVDLDGFKQVNDTLGHDVGDQVLIEMARRMSSAIRSTDLAARMGGDEFVVMFDAVEPDEAQHVAARLRETLLRPLPAALGGASCGASIGLAVSRPGEAAGTLMRRADAAMYCSKRDGGCAVIIAPVVDTPREVSDSDTILGDDQCADAPLRQPVAPRSGTAPRGVHAAAS